MSRRRYHVMHAREVWHDESWCGTIGEVSPTNADDVTCLRCLYLLGRYVPLVKLREHQAAEHYRAEAGK